MAVACGHGGAPAALASFSASHQDWKLMVARRARSPRRSGCCVRARRPPPRGAEGSLFGGHCAPPPPPSSTRVVVQCGGRERGQPDRRQSLRRRGEDAVLSSTPAAHTESSAADFKHKGSGGAGFTPCYFR